MMDFTWYILGVLTGAVAYALYLIARKIPLNWLMWSGLIAGSVLILFSIAWAVGSVLEGVPRAASMGILLFGLSGVVILTLTGKMLKINRLARMFHELLSRDHIDGLATWQLVPRDRGIGSEAYLNGTSQGSTPEDARKDGHICGRSK